MRSLQVLVELAEAAVDTCSSETRLLRLATLRQAVDAAMVAALGEIPDMPATGAALEGGQIGTEKARLLGSARQVDGFTDAEPRLVDQIVGVSLRTARRVVNRFIADHRDQGPGDPAANETTLSPKRNGRWALGGDLDDESARLVHNELRRLAERHRDDESLSLARRMALALVEMVRRSITLGERGPGSRPELVIVADLGLFGDLYNTRHEDGSPVSRQVFENLSCDCTIRGLVMNGPSDPLDLGRSKRLASIGQRRAAAVRDGGCVYPGCDRPPEECELHHLEHWTHHHGPTDIAGLAMLCRRHHTLTHAIGFTFVRHRNGQLGIYRSDGTRLPWPGEQAA